MKINQKEIILEIDHLEKQYEERKILNQVSLQVKKGEVIVILGPSGCGKSTLLRCVNGLEEIQGGLVSFNGWNVHDNKNKIYEVRQKIGMVFQSYELFPHLTILQNVMLGPTKVQHRNKEEVKKEAIQLLERVGLSEKVNAYPRQLSGGQRQRVAIVRALCMKPEIMLLDEITAALDPEMVREVLDVVLELAKQGITMVIVTHEMAFAKAIADRIVFMDEGVILEETTPEQFFSNPSTDRARRFLSGFSYEKVKEEEKVAI
ncbi:amino acid ABC transporter ATP-binding protein [Anaerosporobacter faecicola]|uniref:amino acid ABC transporter ATP-binding protein n=1 Tax=Anaerosporobacter faecicola TaxID=2718714 RepID=UPI002367F791|nr:amino acid ABC transporter ATP-binding protein [Anaerosporobacter faecicola]